MGKRWFGIGNDDRERPTWAIHHYLEDIIATERLEVVHTQEISETDLRGINVFWYMQSMFDRDDYRLIGLSNAALLRHQTFLESNPDRT